MYHLATMHSITDRSTDEQTDRQTTVSYQYPTAFGTISKNFFP